MEVWERFDCTEENNRITNSLRPRNPGVPLNVPSKISPTVKRFSRRWFGLRTPIRVPTGPGSIGPNLRPKPGPRATKSPSTGSPEQPDPPVLSSRYGRLREFLGINRDISDLHLEKNHSLRKHRQTLLGLFDVYLSTVFITVVSGF